ncbi:MAG: uroporphyrinogen-III C-methyltransferase [Chloroflexi bacterium]|nr:uroporphyrinogen-III C-methyltransferase [Chloroflexota bacterium]
MKKGIVYLVGAGPGDPGLLTLKGRECLARADVIIYDHLLEEVLLDAAPPEAERIYVGKSAAAHTLEQPEINELLAARAGEGKTVVRLKGGDPFVFGRGGEEAEVLARRGIPFEVVPGVTSAVAVPAYAGIPVTQRGLASSFAVITGHEDPAKSGSSINWSKLATGVDTLVFLMGVQNLPDIAARLREHGRPPDTPVAVIKSGTRPVQQTVTGTLQDIAGKVREARLSPPAITVVGEVVRLREALRWFDSRPLFGRRVLVTRARHQASSLSTLLAERGARPVELPAIEILPSDTAALDEAIMNLSRYDWLVLTSTNGVAAFFRRLRGLKRDSRALGGIKLAVIGPATAAALAEHGLIADYCPDTYTGEGLLAGFNKLDLAGRRFLLPRADIADKELTEGLAGLGGEVHDIAVYRTVPAQGAVARVRELLRSGAIDVITFTSSSTVTNLEAALGAGAAAGVTVACIGPKTAATAAQAGLKVDIVARESTIPGLVAALEDYFTKEA